MGVRLEVYATSVQLHSSPLLFFPLCVAAAAAAARSGSAQVGSSPLLLSPSRSSGCWDRIGLSRTELGCDWSVPILASDWLRGRNLWGRVTPKGAVGVARGWAPPDGGSLMQPLLLTASRYTGYTWRNNRISFFTGTALVAGKSTDKRPSQFITNNMKASVLNKQVLKRVFKTCGTLWGISFL